MTYSGREARLILRRAGIGDRQARMALAGGLAGQPRTRGSVHAYDEARVDALASRPVLTPAEVARMCPNGHFVARRTDAAPLRTRADQLSALSDGWEAISIWVRIGLRIHLEDVGPLPFVATLAGFVYLGADIVEVRPGGRLVLADPGPWFDQLRGTRMPTGPGRPWHVRLPLMGLGASDDVVGMRTAS